MFSKPFCPKVFPVCKLFFNSLNLFFLTDTGRKKSSIPFPSIQAFVQFSVCSLNSETFVLFRLFKSFFRVSFFTLKSFSNGAISVSVYSNDFSSDASTLRYASSPCGCTKTTSHPASAKIFISINSYPTISPINKILGIFSPFI